MARRTGGRNLHVAGRLIVLSHLRTCARDGVCHVGSILEHTVVKVFGRELADHWVHAVLGIEDVYYVPLAHEALKEGALVLRRGVRS